jgi:hypothetical protein
MDMRDPGNRQLLIDRLAVAIAAALATVFVGFFAFKVRATPLTAIVFLCLALMLYVFWREDRSRGNGEG